MIYHLLLIVTSTGVILNLSQGQSVTYTKPGTLMVEYLGVNIRIEKADLKKEALHLHTLLIHSKPNVIAYSCNGEIKIGANTNKVFIIKTDSSVVQDTIKYDESLFTKRIFIKKEYLLVLVLKSKIKMATQVTTIYTGVDANVYSFLKLSIKIRLLPNANHLQLSSKGNLTLSVKYSNSQRWQHGKADYRLHTSSCLFGEEGTTPWIYNYWKDMFEKTFTFEIIFQNSYFSSKQYKYGALNVVRLRKNLSITFQKDFRAFKNQTDCEMVDFLICNIFTLNVTYTHKLHPHLFSICQFDMEITQKAKFLYPCTLTVNVSPFNESFTLMVPYNYTRSNRYQSILSNTSFVQNMKTYQILFLIFIMHLFN